MRLSWIGMLLMGLAAIAPAQQVAIGEYALPTPSGVALAVAPGPDHALWFAGSAARKTARQAQCARPTLLPQN
jgi:streptogramin lyase